LKEKGIYNVYDPHEKFFEKRVGAKRLLELKKRKKIKEGYY